MNPSHTVEDITTSAPLWHSLEGRDVLERVESTEKGLTAAEARARLKRFGPNVLERVRGDTVLQLLWHQINTPLIYVLLASSALAIVMGKATDGLVVLGVVVLNTLIGFVQEYRAGKAIEALSGMVPETATVLRDGEKVTLPAPELVPGDIVMLQPGDKVPADMRLLHCRTLQIDEAALTGESVPVDKSTDPVPAESLLADRSSMVYSGSLVTHGTATGVVVATGHDTELGRISSLLSEATEIETPLTRSLTRMGRQLTIIILIVAALMFGIGLGRGYSVADATLAAITLAVAAIPEGLPAIITIALAIGVQRMARRRAVIRRLPAVETLGSTTVICSDKTGTLTRNEMTVQELWVPAGSFTVSGIGYAPQGELTPREGNGPEAEAQVRELLLAGLLCNDAALAEEDGVWKISGDPTEGALIVAACKAGFDPKAVREKNPRVDAIPFESERQYMASLHETEEGSCVTYLKGAPEAVFTRCNVMAGGGAPDHDLIRQRVEEMASRGMRVLAFASLRAQDGKCELMEGDVTGGMTFLGLQGMIDPPRPEAVEAIRACRDAGIQVKMITGDHRITAAAIGRQIGILDDRMDALSGHELATMDDEQLRQASMATNVFARVAPEHKLGLVRSLQSQNQVVAMTGDGVNDSPALRQSDIGVAMGITGTAVSKESADIVLTDDNFASIKAAVEEGRRVYDNLVKSLAFVLPTNLGEALILLLAVLFFPIVDGLPLLPMMPTQILWINLVATVALALPLAFEAMEPDIMSRPPRRPGEPIMNRFVVIRTVLVALLMTAAAIGLFLHDFHSQMERIHATGQALEAARETAYRKAQTMAVTTVIFFQIFYLLNCRSLRRSIFRIGLFSNPWIYVGIAVLIVLQLGFIYLPFMHTAFNSAPLPPMELLKAMGLGLLILPVISLEKIIWNWRHTRHRAQKPR